MNEDLIRNIVKCKLWAAEKLMDHLPQEMSDSLRDLGRLILESINENCRELKGEPTDKARPEGLNSIKIE